MIATPPAEILRPSRLARPRPIPRSAFEIRASDAAILASIFSFEGTAYTNAPADRGGPTHYGITMPAWSDWIGRLATVADIKAIDIAGAEAFYRTTRIRPFDVLADPLRLQAVDLGVHRGVRTAIKELQKVAGATTDGWFGQETLGAITTIGSIEVNNLLVGARIVHFENLIAAQPSQAKWRNGWRRRALTFYVSTPTSLGSS
jgi:lysozyme family protein